MQFNTWKEALETNNFNTSLHWKEPIDQESDLNMIRELFIVKFKCKTGEICCSKCGFISYDKLKDVSQHY